jgi:hypothetical protein
VGYYVVDVDGASFSWGKVFYLGSGEGVAGKDVDDALDVLFKTCNGRFELIYLSRVVTRFCVNRGRGRRETVILFLELAVSCRELVEALGCLLGNTFDEGGKRGCLIPNSFVSSWVVAEGADPLYQRRVGCEVRKYELVLLVLRLSEEVV